MCNILSQKCYFLLKMNENDEWGKPLFLLRGVCYNADVDKKPVSNYLSKLR